MCFVAGQKGNLTERMVSVVLCVGLSVASVLGAVYMLIWQTYVLRVEAVLASVQISFIALEFVFGIISVVTFARSVESSSVLVIGDHGFVLGARRQQFQNFGCFVGKFGAETNFR